MEVVHVGDILQLDLHGRVGVPTVPKRRALSMGDGHCAGCLSHSVPLDHGRAEADPQEEHDLL